MPILVAHFRRGEGFIYFGGHKCVQSLSEVFIRVAYPVEPLSFTFVSSQPQAFLPGGIGDGPGQEPDLFGHMNHGQADEFQNFHVNDSRFNFRQSVPSGKRDGAATTLPFGNPPW